jgi:hypothetical protein
MSLGQLIARLDMAYGRNQRAVTRERELPKIRAADPRRGLFPARAARFLLFDDVL